MSGQDRSVFCRLNGSRGERGFLLLETLLALFILSIGLTLVIRSFGSSLGALRTSDDYTQAMLLLEERIWELEAKGSILPGTSGGTFPQEAGKYQWQVSASPPNAKGLSETRVTITFKQRGRPRDLSVVTYLKVESR